MPTTYEFTGSSELCFPHTFPLALICQRPLPLGPLHFALIIFATMSSDPSNTTIVYVTVPVLDSDLYRLTVYDNLVVGIVYGVYIVLYVTSVHILLRKPGFTSSRPRIVMFGITTFMFAMGIIALVLEIALGFQKNEYEWSPHHVNVVFAVEATITRLMYILSDIICAWRAVVLWNRDKRVIAILLLLILGTTAAGGCELGLTLKSNFANLPYYYYIQDGSVPETTGDSGPLIMVGPTLATNLVSTGLIAWKAGQHRVSFRKDLHEGSGSVMVERVFALLIESGFIYCCLWVVYLISALGVMSQPGFTVMEHALLFSSGLYPTLIVVLVAVQKSPIEYYSTYSTRMQLASGPAALGPTRVGDMPRHLYPIRREYASDSDTHIPSMVFMKTPDEEKGHSL
ncbi:hypothetical protein EDB86DRAFT_1942173 [Lactarius hatsudake]|nr:hypothetical protein EDB86DRAFT_1942173 [Lactarius hatsudake]